MKTDEIVERIAELRKKEALALEQAGRFRLKIAELKSRELSYLQQAKAFRDERKDFACQYIKQLNTYHQALIMAEKALGHKLSLEEIEQVEAFLKHKMDKSK